VTYVGILSFEVSSDASDMYALVSAREPGNWPIGTTLLTLPELIETGVGPALIRLFQAAAGRTSAEQFAITIGGSVQRALARSVEYLEERFTVEDARAGWSQYLSNDAVGVLSTAQGLLALAHANVRSRYIEPTACCLEEAQNRDGGWQVMHSFLGEPNDISITESTCYCLWALIEAGRSVDSPVIAGGAAWLITTQRRSGGWGVSERSEEAQVIATAFAVRMLAKLGYRQAVAKGVDWLRSTQCADGGWGFQRTKRSEVDLSSSAPTAHAVITLLSAGVPTTDQAIIHGCAYLRRRFNSEDAEPWPATLFDTLVDPGTSSRLIFRHYTTPWALVALSLAGADLSDPILQRGISRLLALQMESGAWRCSVTFPGMQTVWSAHDAVFALKTVVSIGTANMGPAALRGHADQTIAILESVIVHLLSTHANGVPDTEAQMGA
jgi:prenyltransferase beta subunit